LGKKIIINFMKIILILISLCVSHAVFSQKIDEVITASEVERIEKVLSDDNMEGRKTGTPGIERAADFIAGEFKNNGLQFFNGLKSYRQEFSLIRPKYISTDATFDNVAIDSKNVITITTQPLLDITHKSGYEIINIATGADFTAEVTKINTAGKNYLVIVDTSHAKNFGRLVRLKRASAPKANSVIFVLSATSPKEFHIVVNHEITEIKYANVVGIIPGKSKKNEYVVFSGHYDHLGIGKPDARGDSIYNGANDDAAGTTAVILLSKYFNQIKNNERTLVFVAFTAEEVGGFGSQNFSSQLDPQKVMAMFNIEMIGTESKWGTNSAYITGYEKTDMGKILQSNLTGTQFHFEPDPYPEQKLFYRSDNATLAKLGVPAHTISTSKMDSEANYHKQSDEISTLDMNNMAEIIKAIAISSATIISGKDTPTRVVNEEVK